MTMRTGAEAEVEVVEEEVLVEAGVEGCQGGITASTATPGAE